MLLLLPPQIGHLGAKIIDARYYQANPTYEIAFYNDKVYRVISGNVCIVQSPIADFYSARTCARFIIHRLLKIESFAIFAFGGHGGKLHQQLH